MKIINDYYNEKFDINKYEFFKRFLNRNNKYNKIFLQ